MEEKKLIAQVDFLESKITRFGIKAKVVNVVCSPAYTSFYLDSDDKKCATKLTTFKKDLEILLGLEGAIRFLPKKANQDYFILEVPTRDRVEMSFKEVSKNKEYRRAKWKLPLALGWATCDELAMRDMTKTGNILVAGNNEWELNNFYKTIIASLTERKSAEDVQLITVDKKGTVSARFDGLQNIMIPLLTGEKGEYADIFRWIGEEAERRKKLLVANKLDDVTDLNAFSVTKLPYIVVLVRDAWEFSEDENLLASLQKVISDVAPDSKKLGIYFYYATKKADKKFLTDEFKENFLTKIAFSMSDSAQSMLFLRAKGAENLLGDGDMLVKKGAKTERLQASVMDETSLKQVLKASEKKNKDFVPFYHADEILQGKCGESEGFFFDFAMACEVMNLCFENEGVPLELLQEKLGDKAPLLDGILNFWKSKGFLKKEEETWNIVLTKEDLEAFLAN